MIDEIIKQLTPLINGKSILVKVSGDVIKRAGGIAAGMSGSPVYIDNKLVGGISSGWLMTDHTVGLITPIDEMLEIWNYPSGNKTKTGIKTGCLQKHYLNKSVKIGNKTVGEGYPCFIIAEIGINHNGSIELAKQMIDIAVTTPLLSVIIPSIADISKE